MDAELWGTLSADLARASHHEEMDLTALTDDGWIVWIPFSDMQRATDAPGVDLYLLALLGLVHVDAWRTRALQICERAFDGSARQSIIEAENRPVPRLGIIVRFSSGSIMTEKDIWIRMVDYVFGGHAIFDEYTAIESELVQYATSVGLELSSMDLRTPIRIECVTSDGNLQQIMMLATAQSTSSEPTSTSYQRQRFQRHAKFRLHEVYLRGKKFMNWSDLKYAKKIVENGVRLCRLPLFNVRDTNIMTEDALAAFQALFPADQGSHRGIECASVDRDCPLKLIPALLSAIRNCASVRTLVVSSTYTYGSKKMYPQFWAFVAYALSGRGGRHRIDTLKLDSPIGPECIDAMRDVLHAANPLAALYDGDVSSEPRGRIEARRFQLLDPSTNSTQASVWTSSRLVQVDVIAIGGVWWSVLLPGYGRAWVHQDNIVQRTAYDELPITQGVQRFEYIYADGGIAELELAVEMWGPSLITLISTGSSPKTQVEPDWIERVLSACPCLKRLVLPYVSLARGCLNAITRTAVRLRKFEASVIPNGDASDLVHFFRTLSDENHACTIALKKLRLRIVIKHEEDVAFVSSYATMLAENHTLTKVTLVINDRGYNGHQGAAIGAMLSSTPGRVQRHEIDAPVRRKCRLAFLSAMHHQPSESAMSRLDSSVLTMIFGFAVHRVTRQLEFHYYNPRV